MIINCTVLTKRRSLTRRPTAFSDCEAVVTGEVAPDRSLEAEYITRVRRAVWDYCVNIILLNIYTVCVR